MIRICSASSTSTARYWIALTKKMKRASAPSEKLSPQDCNRSHRTYATYRESGFFLGFFAVLDDVALLKKNSLRDLFPLRLRAEKPFEVHREVFEFFLL